LDRVLLLKNTAKERAFALDAMGDMEGVDTFGGPQYLLRTLTVHGSEPNKPA